MFKIINTNLEILFNNDIFINIIKVFLIYYIIFISFKLNNEIIVLFDNSIIKLLILIIIFYTSTNNIEISILVMFGFLSSLNTLNTIKLNDLLNLDDELEYLDTIEETEINN